MNCQEIKELIPLYLDSELEAQENQSVKKHLTTCQDCQQELGSFQASWEMLKSWEDIKPSPNYVSRFWTKASIRHPWYEKILQGIRQGLLKKRLAPVFIALSVTLLVGFFSLRNYWQFLESEKMLSTLDEDAIEMVENIELVEDFDIIQDIDLFEDLDIIETFDTLDS